MSDIYRELIVDHYKNPRNVGKIEAPDVKGHDDNTVCGDSITFFIRFDESDTVKEVAWEGEGCALSQASASLLSGMMQGKTRQEVEALSEKDILEVVGAQLNPSRLKCATLSVHALQKGLEGS